MDWSVVANRLPDLAQGLLQTLWICAVAVAAGMVIAVLVTWVQLRGPRAVVQPVVVEPELAEGRERARPRIRDEAAEVGDDARRPRLVDSLLRAAAAASFLRNGRLAVDVGLVVVGMRGGEDGAAARVDARCRVHRAGYYRERLISVSASASARSAGGPYETLAPAAARPGSS